MAQQTQVDRVAPKWKAFMEVFPTVSHAANASQADVVRMWDGLGYNRRAIYLHKTARIIVEQYGGNFPTALDELLKLPGVGPYTARAVCVFAFEQQQGVVDTNVGRVFARLGGETLTAHQVQAHADEAVPANASWEWNSALLDFAAGICTKRVPKCNECPVASSCVWRGVGTDPATGSAFVTTPQSKFEGSFRQGRGRIVHALRIRPHTIDELSEIVGWTRTKTCEAIDALATDGVISIEEEKVSLGDGLA